MEQNTAKGSGFLKVTGILMIIGGSLSIILGIIALLGIAALVYLAGSDASAGLLYFSGILVLVSAVAELVAGIIGVINCNKPEKAGVCMAWGIVVAALSVLGSVLTVVGGGDFSIFSLILGLVLPVFYIVGAAKNKQA